MPRLFGKKMPRVRLERQWTQEELAKQLGLAAHVHVSKLEANKDQPSLSLVIRVARILQVSTDYLLRDTIPVEHIGANELVTNANATMAPHFGAVLKSLRIEHNLSQRSLAEKIDITSRAYIATLEAAQDKLPSIEVIVKLANLFGVTTDYLLQRAIADERRSDN